MRTTKNEWKQNYTALTKKRNKKNARQIMPNTAQQNTATTERKKHQINTNKSQQKKSMRIRITSRCLSTTKSTFTTKEKTHRLRPAGPHSTQHAQRQAHSTTRLWCSSSPSTRAGLGCATAKSWQVVTWQGVTWQWVTQQESPGNGSPGKESSGSHLARSHLQESPGKESPSRCHLVKRHLARSHLARSHLAGITWQRDTWQGVT